MATTNVPLCTHFQRGYCAFGNQCRYAHAKYPRYNSPPTQQPYYHQQYRPINTHRQSPNDDCYSPYYAAPPRHYNQYNRPYYHHQSYPYSQRRPGPPPTTYSYNNHRNTSIATQDNNNNLLYQPDATYSRLFPTQREEQMEAYLDYSKPTLVFDIDGTIADIEGRLSLAPGTKSDGTRTAQEWNIVLNGNNYKYDRVIPVAWAYLKYIESLNKYNILYLSGRRLATIRNTTHWLFNLNKYPKGYVIHRFKGMNGQQFKQQQLSKLSEKLNIVGYFGDRIIDDCICCIKANVRPILVVPNEWLLAKHIYGGIGAVINDVLDSNDRLIEQCQKEGKFNAMHQLQNRDVPQAFIEFAKSSKYWNMPYDDLVPLQFATELFDEKNMELLPPAIKLKCEQDELYWNRLMTESEKVLLLNGGKQRETEKKKSIEVDSKMKQFLVGDTNEIKDDNGDEETEECGNGNNAEKEEEAIRKFLESSEEEENWMQAKKASKIPFHFEREEPRRKQRHYQWVPVGYHTLTH